jgi:hypothetical protein
LPPYLRCPGHRGGKIVVLLRGGEKRAFETRLQVFHACTVKIATLIPSLLPPSSMGTITAQILVGSPHLYHDGLMPTHQVFLSENSRPARVLTRPGLVPPLPTPQPPGEAGAGRRPLHRLITWIRRA